MITLFIICLFAVGLMFAAMPVIALTLMLETSAKRAESAARGETECEEAPISSLRFALMG